MELKVFQRTPQWVFPAPNPRYSRISKAALTRWPVLNKISLPLMAGSTASI